MRRGKRQDTKLHFLTEKQLKQNKPKPSPVVIPGRGRITFLSFSVLSTFSINELYASLGKKKKKSKWVCFK